MRRQFGTVEARSDRPGCYVRFHWRGRRYKRYGGMTRAVAQKRLAEIQVLLESGKASLANRVRRSAEQHREILDE